jgi:hypothetical protein
MKQPQWSEIVGMPDAFDKKNIQSLIRAYEATFPGKIKHIVDEERREEHEQGHGGTFDPYLMKNKASEMRKVIVMPAELVQELKTGYPTIFTDKNHFAWFVRNFPQFRVADKY